MLKKFFLSGLCYLVILLGPSSIQAQEIGFGLKAGLSFSSLNGDLHQDESRDFKSGFHVGPTLAIKFTDVFGLRVELLYNQLGTSYEFEGESYYVLRAGDEKRVIYGEKEVKYDNFISYVDIPIQAYIKLGSRIELYGGVNFMIFGGGTAAGTVTYSSPLTGSLKSSLDYRFNTDKAGEAERNESDPTVALGGRTYSIPNAVGAYFDHDEKDGRAMNNFDLGINGGMSFFFNEALYISGRLYYGFTDVTNNKMDIRQETQSNAPIEFSDDKDTNISYQISVGFSF